MGFSHTQPLKQNAGYRNLPVKSFILCLPSSASEGLEPYDTIPSYEAKLHSYPDTEVFSLTILEAELYTS